MSSAREEKEREEERRGGGPAVRKSNQFPQKYVKQILPPFRKEAFVPHLSFWWEAFNFPGGNLPVFFRFV